METDSRCQSCSMPVEAGPLCQHCSDEGGELLPFDECLERFVQWTRHNEAEIDPEAAELKTLQFMAGMPAWADHPELKARLEREA